MQYLLSAAMIGAIVLVAVAPRWFPAPTSFVDVPTRIHTVGR